MKETFLSWTLSALPTPTILYTPLCIEKPHIQRDIWTGIPTILYLQKRSVIQSLTQKAKMVYSTPELLAKEMDYLNEVLCRNSYLDWLLKKPNNRPHMDQAPTQETTDEAFVSDPYIQALGEEFRRIFKDTKAQIIFKGCNTLKTPLMHPKDKIPTELCQDVGYQLICPEDNCNSYIGE